MDLMNKKTKIVATLGPSSDSYETIRDMILNGVNIFRLNFSHGDHEYHKKNIEKIREIQKDLNVKIGILQDICGPKIRIGNLKEVFNLKINDKLDIHKEQIVGERISENHYKVCINQPSILSMLKSGDYVYLYDGLIRAKVLMIKQDIVETLIENEGSLNSNKGVNFPNTILNIDVITEKDKIDMEFGAKNDVDFVALSFVQNEKDILQARQILKNLNSKAKLLAKIEKFDAVQNIDSIIKNSDGIMVARGDLGIEVPFYKVPSIQKLIIKKANAAAKPVITATQMMLSMAQNRAATRAEISDVANAVLDGTDAVMLSEESAVGINPIGVVNAMSQTILQAEEIYPYNKFNDFKLVDDTDMVAKSACMLASSIKAKSLICITSSGKSAIKMARNRPDLDIIAITHDEKIANYLTLAWGIKVPFIIEKDKLENLISTVVKKCVSIGLINENETYLVTAGYPTGIEGSTNFIKILKKSQIEYYLNY